MRRKRKEKKCYLHWARADSSESADWVSLALEESNRGKRFGIAIEGRMIGLLTVRVNKEH